MKPQIGVSSKTLPCCVDVARAFSVIAHEPGAVLLETQPGVIGGRYSIICMEPFAVLHTEDKGKESPLEILRKMLHARATAPGETVFTGGAVGYLGYELRRFTEGPSVTKPNDVGLPDCWLGFYDAALVFDHQTNTVQVNALEDSKSRDMLEKLVWATIDSPQESRCTRVGKVTSNFTKSGYCAAVRRAKEYISAGDIYQVNLSQRFTVRTDISSWELYMRLRKLNPAPYAAYINLGTFQVVSSSPECFLEYDSKSRMVCTRPIKGTRPRSQDPAEDKRLAEELSASKKDYAENVMIVDLERNDLGRVCEFGTVKVPCLAEIESFATVHHLVSTVTGRMRTDCDAVDLLKATFPGGSITGAPKIRAMEIIEELEPNRRGVYTGSIGFLGFDGSINLNIAIRTAVMVEEMCYFQAGGGIVADSDPEMEYQETLDKARAFFEVLECETI